jgi:Ca2+-binding RTX toxin-like protein
MAKFKYFYNYEAGFSQFQDMSLVNINGAKTEAIWTNEGGAVISFEGKGFKGNLTDDVLTAGQVTSITVMHPEVGKLVTISDLDIKATKIMDKLEDGGEAMLFFLSKGDDRVIGHGGEDLMFGGAGDDVLTGKGGSDMFYFRRYDEGGSETAKASRERDVITDFHTTGENADTLYVDPAELTDYKKANNGKDTLITFDDRSTLLLEGVKRSEFKAYLDSFDDMPL